jgi:pimeloyl-ACP methyl ester carboxylesterase
MEKLDIAGLRIAYERAGCGSPLVLLHGGVTDSRDWRRQMPAFARGFDVIAWDAPGCGQSSDPPEETFRLADYADCLAGLVTQLELDRPHLLGLSFGSGLALEVYKRHPEIPRTLILASAYAGWAGSLPREEVEARLHGVLRDSDRPPEELVGVWLPSLRSESTPPEAVDDIVAIVSEFHPVGARAMARAFAEADLRDVLPSVEVPTLLLYGDQDQRSPLHVARELHDRIPNSELQVISGVGHMSNYDDPQRFNDAVLTFLRAHDH